MNSWSISGNIGKDAEQKFTGSGDSIVSFSVAVKAGYGEKATTTWARCSMFGKRGESVLPYLKKGQLVGVVGEMAAREWQNKEGQTQTSIEVRVNELTLLGKKEPSQQSNEYDQTPASQKEKPKPSSDYSDLEDSIPF